MPAKTMSATGRIQCCWRGAGHRRHGQYSYAIGDPVIFSGLCTTGSRTVILTLTGPLQFTNGVSLGTQTVNADNTWSYRYMTSYGMPVGTYTILVRDAQGTASGSASFSLTT